MNKTAIVIAAVLTALILLSAGGVFYAVRAATGTTAAATTVTDPATPSPAPLTSQREAAYQAQIQAANQRLVEAQATEQALQAQVDSLQQALQGAPSGSVWAGGEAEHLEHGERFDEHNLFSLFGERDDD
ncbi:MAG: hypothetical protein GYA17_17780 [Chloroflexi bacterium]|nr:hypothetical protein [Chloroflexota bacterium]